MRIEVPPAVLDVSRPDLGDLRLLATTESETPYLVDSPRPWKSGPQEAAGFKVALAGSNTVIDVDSGVPGAIEGIELVSPAREFLKSVSIEGGNRNGEWRQPPINEVIFRQPAGAERLRIALPPGPRESLRITVNDDRSVPIAFTGVRVVVAGEKPETDVLRTVLGAREEAPGQTRLTLDLGARNLDVAELRFEIPDAVFSRTCKLEFSALQQNGESRMESLGSGTLYRVTGERAISVEQLSIPVNRRIAARYLVATFRNEDSPPLTITGAEVRIYPTSLAFFAPQAGTYRLLAGNRVASPPSYDLETLRGSLGRVSGRSPTPAVLNSKADFKAPPALPGVESSGTAIDLAKWSRQRKVAFDHPGVIGIELDARVLAACRTDLGDLRLVQNGKQLPYLVRPTKSTRVLKPSQVSEKNDPERPSVSRWEITLPLDGLPVTRLSAKSSTGLFTRRFVAQIERQGSSTAVLSSTDWTRNHTGGPAEFSLNLSDRRVPAKITLETDNGDNPPVRLDDFTVEFAAPTITAKLADTAPLVLCYGNSEAAPPLYDLRLMWDELMAAAQQSTTLGDEEILKPDAPGPSAPDAGSPWLWLALGGVVTVLLVVVAKLLPQPAQE